MANLDVTLSWHASYFLGARAKLAFWGLGGSG